MLLDGLVTLTNLAITLGSETGVYCCKKVNRKLLTGPIVFREPTASKIVIEEETLPMCFFCYMSIQFLKRIFLRSWLKNMNFQANGELIVPIGGPIATFIPIPWTNTALFRNVIVFPTNIEFSTKSGALVVSTDSFSINGSVITGQSPPTVTVNLVRTFPVGGPPPTPVIRVELIHHTTVELPNGTRIVEGQVETFQVAGWFLTARLGNAIKGDLIVVRLNVPVDGTWAWRVGISSGC